MYNPLGVIFAQAISNPLLPSTLTNLSAQNFFGKLLTTVVTIFIIAGIIVFLFMFIAGSIQWITAGSDKGSLVTAKKKVQSSIIGLPILLLTFFFMNTIGCFLGINILSYRIGQFEVGLASSPFCPTLGGGNPLPTSTPRPPTITPTPSITLTPSPSPTGQQLTILGATLIRDIQWHEVAYAYVSLINSNGDTVSTTLSNSSGIFQFDNVAPGTYTLNACVITDTPEALNVSFSGIRINITPPSLSADIYMTEGPCERADAYLSGQARWRFVSWQPAPYTSVWIINEDTGEIEANVTADHFGFYLFNNLPVGRYSMVGCNIRDGESYTGIRTGLISPSAAADVYLLPGACPY